MTTPTVYLGDEVEDTISGFKGVALARTTYITGCDRILVQPKVDKDGKLGQCESFDITVIKVTKKGPKHLEADKEAKALNTSKPAAKAAPKEKLGGPQPSARRRDIISSRY